MLFWGFICQGNITSWLKNVFWGEVADNNLGYLERAITVGRHPLLSKYTENILFKFAIEYTK